MNRHGGRHGNMGPGILGDNPRALSQDISGVGLLGDLPLQGVGGMQQNMMGNNLGLLSGDIEALLQQRQLAQQLSMRESQLAMATNMLQQQSQMLEGISPSSVGNMGPGRMGQSGMIPSLLDMPSQRIRKRPMDMDNMDVKRPRQNGSGRSSRWDQSMEEGDGHFRRRSPSRDRFRRRSLETGRRSLSPRRDRPGIRSGMRNSGQSPYFCHVCKLECRNDQGFKAHMQSDRHHDQLSELGNLHKQTAQEIAGRIKAQAHLRRLEQTNRPGFCKLCDSEIPILFQRHRLTTIHKKREQQVHRGCGWCNVKNFDNFTDVLNHRQTRKHKENEKKFGKKSRDLSPIFIKRRDDVDRSKVSLRKDESGKNKESRKEETSKSKDSLKREESERSKGSTRREDDKTREQSPKEQDKKSPVKSNATEKEDSGPKYDPDTAVGQNFVISVTGFFCKLCHKFYNNETAAKITHCKSQPHFDKWKKAKLLVKSKTGTTTKQVPNDDAVKSEAVKDDTESTLEAKICETEKSEDVEKPTADSEDMQETTAASQFEDTQELDPTKSDSLQEDDKANKSADDEATGSADDEATGSVDDKNDRSADDKDDAKQDEDDILKQEDNMVEDDADNKDEEDQLLSLEGEDVINNDNAETAGQSKEGSDEEVEKTKMVHEDEGADVEDTVDCEEPSSQEVAESPRGRGRAVRGRRSRRGRK